MANSYKNQGRCIAGIDEQSGRWIRPISKLDDGRIPVNFQSIGTEHIALLDIVDIPLEPESPGGYEVENRGYANLPWSIIGKAPLAHLLPYCEDQLLYPQYGKAIPFRCLEVRSPVRTLQLIEVTALSCCKNHRDRWRGIIADEQYGLATVQLSITDPIALDRLERGLSLSSHCLLCMSFSKPWCSDPTDELLCYRLIAGVIELLPELEMILMEMQRVSWAIAQGRQYLHDHFDKQSRYQLTQLEAQQFLNDLRKLRPPKM
ncbi:MAG: hypothetical protein AB4042_07790 [Leptolyngbyaceae cyanobacterium]